MSHQYRVPDPMTAIELMEQTQTRIAELNEYISEYDSKHKNKKNRELVMGTLDINTVLLRMLRARIKVH